MDRLTHPRGSGIKTGYWSPEKKDALIERLAAYEDTGLTPQDIYSLKEGTILKALGESWIPVEEIAVDESYLYDWYIASVDNSSDPVWTDGHISELCTDFVVIPKQSLSKLYQKS